MMELVELTVQLGHTVSLYLAHQHVQFHLHASRGKTLNWELVKRTLQGFRKANCHLAWCFSSYVQKISFYYYWTILKFLLKLNFDVILASQLWLEMLSFLPWYSHQRTIVKLQSFKGSRHGMKDQKDRNAESIFHQETDWESRSKSHLCHVILFFQRYKPSHNYHFHDAKAALGIAILNISPLLYITLLCLLYLPTILSHFHVYIFLTFLNHLLRTRTVSVSLHSRNSPDSWKSYPECSWNSSGRTRIRLTSLCVLNNIWTRYVWLVPTSQAWLENLREKHKQFVLI